MTLQEKSLVMLNFASGIAKAAHHLWSHADWMEIIILNCSTEAFFERVACRKPGLFFWQEIDSYEATWNVYFIFKSSGHLLP